MSRGGNGVPQADDGGEQVLITDERLMIFYLAQEGSNGGLGCGHSTSPVLSC